MNKANKQECHDNKPLLWQEFYAVALAVTVLCFAVYFLSSFIPLNTHTSDLFNILNVLFTGLAFAGVTATYYIQRTQLAIQKEELEDQNRTLALQRFESTFFNMLSRHESLYGELSVKNYGSTSEDIYGRKIFKTIFLNIVQPYESRDIADQVLAFYPDNVSNSDAMNQFISKIYFCYHDVLYPYLSSLYQLLKYIDLSKLSVEDKQTYFDIVRSQISAPENGFLFFYCLATIIKLPEDKRFVDVDGQYSMNLAIRELNKKYKIVRRFQNKNVPSELFKNDNLAFN